MSFEFKGVSGLPFHFCYDRNPPEQTVYEPHHEKTVFLHMRKQRRRSAAQ